MQRWLLLSLLTVVPLAHALDLPYDADADAKAQVQQALAAGRQAHKPTLLIFGANWCGDCRARRLAPHGQECRAGERALRSGQDRCRQLRP
ncbi:thioredoxin domain-containing protein [Xanthomonas graminis]|uniref:hypothetical protein n=1 Tax=Xanthomonas graminis TaxID=3390026 RepID=UPI002541BA4E|nr:hypothetical protein [Xanthomonas translucens]